MTWIYIGRHIPFFTLKHNISTQADNFKDNLTAWCNNHITFSYKSKKNVLKQMQPANTSHSSTGFSYWVSSTAYSIDWAQLNTQPCRFNPDIVWSAPLSHQICVRKLASAVLYPAKSVLKLWHGSIRLLSVTLPEFIWSLDWMSCNPICQILHSYNPIGLPDLLSQQGLLLLRPTYWNGSK